ncbi:hypothetical protein E4U21_001532 [Claviceps maximensis]|nr:hypothetical protein E4U21_001532 [Claviceps maximensis]
MARPKTFKKSKSPRSPSPSQDSTPKTSKTPKTPQRPEAEAGPLECEISDQARTRHFQVIIMNVHVVEPIEVTRSPGERAGGRF